MTSRRILLVTCALVLLLAACGGGSKSGSPEITASPNSTTANGGAGNGNNASGTTDHVALPAGNEPSESAKMICEPEATDEIASVLGVKQKNKIKPTWSDHVYACDLDYGGGAVLRMSVKEVSNVEETTATFNQYAQQYGKTADYQGLGQGAFTTTGGSVVVRKDFKVLLVDISKLPDNFGVPPASRRDVAINVASTIMGCWTGA